MQVKRPIRIGTRGSPLALAQAYEVRGRLKAAHGLEDDDFLVKVIRTSGDRIQDRALSEIGGKGLFTKEIEEELLADGIDLAVHSMKDMPTVLPSGLEISCLLPREDVRDAFISPVAASLDALPAGSLVGTSSLRREAQVRRLRPDLQVVPFRGNVQTRLRKLDEKIADATFLAVAGLNRLGLGTLVTQPVPPEVMLPAVAQGAIGIEIRMDDDVTRNLLTSIHEAATAVAVTAERAFLARLDGSCRTPIAGLAEHQNGRLRFRGLILLPDGSQAFETAREGSVSDAVRMGDDAAAELLRQAGPSFLKN